jgi:hypothetical protein
LKDEPNKKVHGKKISDIIRDACFKFETEAPNAYATRSNLVMVVEAWHLPSGKDAEDGKYVMFTSAGILDEQEYTKNYFPFVFLRWTKPIMGFWGQSLAERIAPIQLEITSIVRDLQSLRNLFSVPWIGIESGSKVKRADVNNILAHTVDYTNSPPQFMTPPMAHSQWFDWLSMLQRQAYEIAGVSQLSATSKKPSGLDAAVALREYQDIESERFALVAQEYDAAVLASVRVVIDLAREIANDTGSYVVKLAGKEFTEEIDFKKIDLEDSRFTIKLFPTSMLPEHPAARAQKLSEWQQLGYIDQEEFFELSEFPDLKYKTQLATANIHLIRKQISDILHRGVYMPPLDDQDLKRTLKMVVAAKLRAIASGAPDDRVALLDQFQQEVNGKLEIQQPPAPPEGGAPAAPEAPASPPMGMPLPQEMPQ